jgi:hypothetical protein
VARSDDELLVEIAGRRQVVSNILVPDARAGDDVLIGMGRALTHLTPAEAAELRLLLAPISTAAGTPASASQDPAPASPRLPIRNQT